jgi:hypothetical protein
VVSIFRSPLFQAISPVRSYSPPSTAGGPWEGWVSGSASPPTGVADGTGNVAAIYASSSPITAGGRMPVTGCTSATGTRSPPSGLRSPRTGAGGPIASSLAGPSAAIGCERSIKAHHIPGTSRLSASTWWPVRFDEMILSRRSHRSSAVAPLCLRMEVRMGRSSFRAITSGRLSGRSRRSITRPRPAGGDTTRGGK